MNKKYFDIWVGQMIHHTVDHGVKQSQDHANIKTRYYTGCGLGLRTVAEQNPAWFTPETADRLVATSFPEGPGKEHYLNMLETIGIEFLLTKISYPTFREVLAGNHLQHTENRDTTTSQWVTDRTHPAVRLLAAPEIVKLVPETSRHQLTLNPVDTIRLIVASNPVFGRAERLTALTAVETVDITCPHVTAITETLTNQQPGWTRTLQHTLRELSPNPDEMTQLLTSPISDVSHDAWVYWLHTLGNHVTPAEMLNTLLPRYITNLQRRDWEPATTTVPGELLADLGTQPIRHPKLGNVPVRVLFERLPHPEEQEMNSSEAAVFWSNFLTELNSVQNDSRLLNIQITETLLASSRKGFLETLDRYPRTRNQPEVWNKAVTHLLQYLTDSLDPKTPDSDQWGRAEYTENELLREGLLLLDSAKPDWTIPELLETISTVSEQTQEYLVWQAWERRLFFVLAADRTRGPTPGILRRFLTVAPAIEGTWLSTWAHTKILELVPPEDRVQDLQHLVSPRTLIRQDPVGVAHYLTRRWPDVDPTALWESTRSGVSDPNLTLDDLCVALTR